jgi:hypothetical protein
MCGRCLNRKVLGALAAVGLGLWVVAPGAFGLALPVLIMAACPISMLLMMRGRQGGQCATGEAEINQPASTELGRQERLAELRASLGTTEAEHEAIAREIAKLETGPPAGERESAAVAQGAHERGRGSS